jgi:hypothetical protein
MATQINLTDGGIDSLLTSSQRKPLYLDKVITTDSVKSSVQWLEGNRESVLEQGYNGLNAIRAETWDFYCSHVTALVKKLQSTLTWATFSPIFGVCSAPWKNLAEPLSCMENCNIQTQKL